MGCHKDATFVTKFRAADGIPLKRRRRKVVPHKSRYFTDIDSSSVKTVVDRRRLAAHHKKHCG